jgi:hypothetical protein
VQEFDEERSRNRRLIWRPRRGGALTALFPHGKTAVLCCRSDHRFWPVKAVSTGPN